MNRIEKLLANMTLTEKLGQLTMTAAGHAVTGPIIAGDSTEAIRSGAIGNLLNLVGAGPVREMQRLAVEESRLKIPLLIGLDIIHGHRTLFPIPLAETALFDPAVWEQTAREAATEACFDGLAMTFAPMVDVARDIRWGRTAEGPGEDPWVAAQLAQAKVRGFQGAQLTSAVALAACAKHFCGYGAVTAGREYASVDISDRTLQEVHLPAFDAAVRAGVATIMPAFTDLAGVPMTANATLLRQHLREQMGFEGVLVSDYNAIGELMRHGIAADPPEAAALALNAGVDIDMMSDAYRHGLPIALKRGLVTQARIDESVRRVLHLKERLGLFEDPYRRGTGSEDPQAIERRLALSRAVARRAIVMLKNDGEALPPHQELRRLAVIGPLADAGTEMGGCWAAVGEPDKYVSVLAGLRHAMPGVQIVHSRGVAIDKSEGADVGAALEACRNAEAIVLCVGEAAAMSGEAASRAHPGLPGRQLELAQAVARQAQQQGAKLISVLFSGRPLVIPELAAMSDALLAAWFLGNEAGHAVADILRGAASPSGRTPMSWPQALGQMPIFYGERPGGRPFNARDHFTSKYLDVANEPLFPFGHGLSYGDFQLANLRVTPQRLTESDTIEVRVEVTNSGKHSAEETVFVFTHDKLATVSRPVLELRTVGKITLAAGATATLDMQFPARELRFLGQQLRSVFEAGEVEVLVGPCAERSRLLVASVQLQAPATQRAAGARSNSSPAA
ncbi:MAG: glycoside hydrolase family 3 C-terminal domain-containing protein [Sinobacteraceae bacterium]|nr:glycoside hydrolase family 3 C-terminal domain-containing protein [Nevskiaceae bacterium]